MKANPDNRWRKMPPGSAESLPPSNAKPYTPSLSNGVTCGKLLNSSPVHSDQAMSDNDQISQNSAPAPKPFKKRYLASNQAPGGSNCSSVSPGHTPPSPSPVSSVAVSPEAATACEALMELSRTDGRASRSSEGSGSGSERRGSPSDTQPAKTLRQAVWTNVATTLLKQEEDKLVEPPKDSPMNLSQQCTIRGQQIIEHIIENILDKPAEGLSPNVSVNNNQEESIKDSIYESLKNDLLKGKATTNGKSVSAPVSPPGASVPVSVGSAVKVTPVTKPSPVPLLLNQGSKLPMHNMTTVTTVSPSSSSSSPPSHSSSHSPNSVTPPGPGHQDVLKLLARNSQVPIGNSAITITKTPRVTQSHPATSVAAISPTPVSVSLTRTGSNQVFNLSSIGGTAMPVVLTSQPGVMLATHPPQGSVVLTGMAGHQTSECVLLSPASSQGLILQQAGVAGGALQQGQVVIAPATGQPLLIAAGRNLILAPTVQPQQQQQPHRLISTATTSTNSVTISQSIPVINNDSDPVNLSVRSTVKSPDSSSSVSVTPQVSPLKRPASDADGEDDDIRRSSRHSKGRKYQEFMEDGRLNLSIKNKRRSHKSGNADDSIDGEMDTAVPLDQNDCKPSDHSAPSISNNQINHHWKKKLRTVSLGENTQSHVTSGLPPPAHAHQLPPVTITATMSNTANNQHPDPGQYHKSKEDFDTRNNHRLVSRSSARQQTVSPAAGGRNSFDVKLGNKKLRGEKISH